MSDECVGRILKPPLTPLPRGARSFLRACQGENNLFSLPDKGGLGWVLSTLPVSSCTLYESILSPKGPFYRSLMTFPLA